MKQSDIRKQVLEYMKSEGFWIHRSGKHLIWTDGTVQIVTAKSPSDYRALLNIKSIVKRTRAKAQERAA
jgi:hypothetical protein